jgi:hypothetical protein
MATIIEMVILSHNNTVFPLTDHLIKILMVKSPSIWGVLSLNTSHLCFLLAKLDLHDDNIDHSLFLYIYSSFLLLFLNEIGI